MGYNRAEDAHAGTASQEAVSEIQKQIEQAQTVAMETQVTNQEDNINHSPEPSMDEILESDAEPYTTGPVTMVGDYEYIGVLDLPARNLSLPIMSDWDYERLKMAPCRQFGSAATDDLVIAGHNYITTSEASASSKPETPSPLPAQTARSILTSSPRPQPSAPPRPKRSQKAAIPSSFTPAPTADNRVS